MSIEQHYSEQLDIESLLTELQQRYPDGPDCYQLAPIDQLHIGGIKASQKLVSKLEQLQPKRILEIGSGMGGLIRLIKSNLPEVRVIGIDITHNFNCLNHSFNGMTNTTADAITGDAQSLPFAENSFDCIIFQHSLLNIPDNSTCLNECRRVLNDGGSLLLHEVVKGQEHDNMRYPVPWARTPEQSHLLTADQLEQELSAAGFAITTSDNWSDEALQWRKRQAVKEQSSPSAPTLSPIQVLGQDFKKMGPNVMANLSANAVEVRQILCRLN